MRHILLFFAPIPVKLGLVQSLKRRIKFLSPNHQKTTKHVLLKKDIAQLQRGLFVYFLVHVTVNDILVIYVTALRCAGNLKKVDLWLGSNTINIWYDSFTSLSMHWQGTTILTVLSKRLELFIEQWESNLQPKDDPKALSLD